MEFTLNGALWTVHNSDEWVGKVLIGLRYEWILKNIIWKSTWCQCLKTCLKMWSELCRYETPGSVMWFFSAELTRSGFLNRWLTFCIGCLTSGLHLDYIENDFISTIRRWRTQWKQEGGKRFEQRLHQRRCLRWQENTWTDAQRYSSLGDWN